MNKIKGAVKIIVVWIFSTTFPFKVVNRICSIVRVIYSKWVGAQFCCAGINVHIGYPIQLIGGEFIEIGNESGLGARGILAAWGRYNGEQYSPKINIGNHVWIGEGFHISSADNIRIGNHVLMGIHVSIIDNAHGVFNRENLAIEPYKRKLFSKGPITINDNVWIGDKVTILSGVEIGTGSIIGANSVVTRNIPNNCVACGIPARVIKQLRG